LKHRKAVYQQAKLRNPNRWSGEIRNWDKVEEVYLNPENQKTENEQKERIKGKSQTHSFLFSKTQHQLTIKFDNINLKNI
jgi:hypothetical protein